MSVSNSNVKDYDGLSLKAKGYDGLFPSIKAMKRYCGVEQRQLVRLGTWA